MANPDLHPECRSLAGLLGTWRGEGIGEYPTIESFGYVEEVTFGHVGKPFLRYDQRTRDASDGLPLHAETGYWRPTGPGHVEVVLSHPTGVAEVLEGSVNSGPVTVFDLHTTSVALTSTAKSVTQLHRRFELEGDVLRYRLAMAAVGQPLTHHLSAELRRVGEGSPTR
jgi:hypothetical protein